MSGGLGFILSRLLDLALTIIGVSFICFILIRLIPGDPVTILVGERGASAEYKAELRESLGLNQSLPMQYFIFAKKAISGDLGRSIASHDSVWNEFTERFPATFELSICAMAISIFIAIPMGIFAALYRNSFFDYSLMSLSLVGFSMPIFWWGLILILVFSVHFGMTPVSGRIAVEYDIPKWTGLYLFDTLQTVVTSVEGLGPFKSAVRHLILPSITLATIPLAVLARMTRSAMLDVLGEDFIRTAYAKGLSPIRVIAVHAFRNALVPIVTSIGLLTGMLLVGAVLTENIFSWPGVGKWIVHSIIARDYPVIQSGILLLSMVVVATNVFVDVVYLMINPRLRKQMLKG